MSHLKQTVRIIGGQYRGKKIFFPCETNLRPTSDRIRETVFNWLMHDIIDAQCLDAFAGSGALGFEALSRGAACITLVEQSTSIYRQLIKTAKEFNTSNLRIIQNDVCDYLKKTKDNYSIVFMDPPFSALHLLSCISILESTNTLVPHGLLYLEAPHEIPLNSLYWEKLKLKKAGNVTYGLYRKIASPDIHQ